MWRIAKPEVKLFDEARFAEAGLADNHDKLPIALARSLPTPQQHGNPAMMFAMAIILFPKLALGGVADKRPCTPLPLNAIVKLRSEALLVIVILPVTSPAASGAKWACKFMLRPAESFNGVASLLTEKPLPLTLT